MNINNEIAEALKVYLDAFNEMNWDIVSNSLDESFTYFTDKAIKQDKKEFIDFMSTNPWCGTNYNIDNLRVLADDAETTAIACYDSEFNGKHKDIPMTVKAVETTVFRKVNNVWKIVHSHTSNK